MTVDLIATEASPPPLIEKMCLGEHPDLPIGIRRGDGSIARSFTFGRWGAREDLEVGRIIESSGGATLMPVFAAKVLGLFATSWGGLELPPVAKLDERALLFNRGYAADFLQGWIGLRRHALGDELPMELTCRGCKASIDFTADLSTLETHVVHDHAALVMDVPLRDGFEYRGQTYPGLKVGPVRWGGYSAMIAAQRQNLNAIRLSTVQSAICGVMGFEREAFVTFDDLVAGLTKHGVETLYAAVEKRKFGPDLELDVVCEGCGIKNNDSISWDYASFFSLRGSSRSGR